MILVAQTWRILSSGGDYVALFGSRCGGSAFISPEICILEKNSTNGAGLVRSPAIMTSSWLIDFEKAQFAPCPIARCWISPFLTI